jgi:hypothetical protein
MPTIRIGNPILTCSTEEERLREMEGGAIVPVSIKGGGGVAKLMTSKKHGLLPIYSLYGIVMISRGQIQRPSLGDKVDSGTGLPMVKYVRVDFGVDIRFFRV